MQKEHYILWTSGWDSTFRILQLVLEKKIEVQPIYILDKERKSLNQELKAIENITQKLFDQFPESKNYLKPIWFVNKEEIENNTEIEKAFHEIKGKRKIGSQYEWIAKFCYSHHLTQVELCVEKNLDLTSFGNFIKKNYLEIADSEIQNNPHYKNIETVFKYFEFPVINMLKTDMLKIAKQNKWLDILYLTWFCHNPKNNIPCGKCNPCTDVIKKGLSYRIPFKNRIKGYLKIYKKKLSKW